MKMPVCLFRPSRLTKTFERQAPGAVSLPTACLAALLAVCSAPQPAAAQNGYLDHKLVSDLPGMADFTDTNLVNPWGIAFSPTGPFWISDNHAGVSTIYNSSGTPQSLIVTVPPPVGGTPPAAPTGIVFNNTAGFLVGSNAPAHFIFATEDGTVIAWNSGTNAVLKVDNSGAGTVYKGLALAHNGTNTYLYATDFHNGKIDVFDANFSPTTLPGTFADPNIAAGFAPFGIENVGGQLFVTYALQDADRHDDVSGLGNGYVDAFDTSGNLLKRFATSNHLNSPWGMAQAPAQFGGFGGALLIGNFGDGQIHAYAPDTGTWLGSLSKADGSTFAVDGLWGLKFGNGGNGGDAHTLYYTAGIPGSGSVEDHGLFGSLTSVYPAFTGVTDKGLAAGLTWAGGAGSFLLQSKANLSDSNWFNVLSTSDRSVTVAQVPTAGFYRVFAPTTNTVLAFTVLLNGASEVPPVTNSTATAVGMIAIEGSNLTYRVSFEGLSAAAFAAHIHGPATPTNAANVLIPLNGASGTAGTLSGTVTLTSDERSNIVNGLTYMNIHTSPHQGGEIRGQIVPLRMTVHLDGPSEVPPVTTSATGTGTLDFVGSQMYYSISYSGLSAPAIAAHFHGPADASTPAAVLFPLTTPTGTSGTISGTTELSPLNLAYLLAGQTYVNIHTTNHPAGEIRGQVLLPH